MNKANSLVSAGSGERKIVPEVPPFVTKLITMINAPDNRNLIRWSDSGKSFIVLDADRLAAEELSKYFKTTTFASLVRQLNMYGFRKVTGVTTASSAAPGAKSDRHVEFTHEFVHRDRPKDLEKIRRKDGKRGGINNPEQVKSHPMFIKTVGKLSDDIQLLKRENDRLREEMHKSKNGNLQLEYEISKHQTRHRKQQWTIDQIMKKLSYLHQKGFNIREPSVHNLQNLDNSSNSDSQLAENYAPTKKRRFTELKEEMLGTPAKRNRRKSSITFQSCLHPDIKPPPFIAENPGVPLEVFKEDLNSAIEDHHRTMEDQINIQKSNLKLIAEGIKFNDLDNDTKWCDNLSLTPPPELETDDFMLDGMFSAVDNSR